MLSTHSQESRRPIKARDSVDRRTQPDRRRSSVDMRLRVGLWYQYHRATRAGEFDPLPRNQYTHNKVHEALLPEMCKYEFFEPVTKAAVAPARALTASIEFLWAHPELGCNAAGEPMAVYTINGLAEFLVRTYRVTVIDRRKADRRSATALGS